MKSNGGRVHGNSIFSAEEEEALLAMILAYDRIDMPLNIAGFKAHVKKFAGDRKMANFDAWKKSFFSRHKDRVVLRKAKNLKAERKNPEMYLKVVNWVGEVERIMCDSGLSWKALVNADETRINLMGDQQTASVLTDAKGSGSGSRSKVSKQGADASRFVTMLPFTQATGELLMVVYVLPMDKNNKTTTFHLMQRKTRGRGTYPVYLMFSKTGYLQKNQWLLAVEKFREVWFQRNPGLKPILVLDQLAAHRSEEALTYYLENDIIALYLVACSTHFTQPQDDLIFANFKRAVYRYLEAQQSTIAIWKRTIGQMLFMAAQEAESKLTKEVIEASFRNVGLYPFDKERILENAKKNCHVEDEVESRRESVEERLADVMRTLYKQPIRNKNFQRIKATGGPQACVSSQDLLEAVREKKRKKKERRRKGRRAQGSTEEDQRRVFQHFLLQRRPRGGVQNASETKARRRSRLADLPDLRELVHVSSLLAT